MPIREEVLTEMSYETANAKVGTVSDEPRIAMSADVHRRHIEALTRIAYPQIAAILSFNELFVNDT